jgi:RNase H
LALSSYTISSSLVSQCWSSLQELSTHNRVKMLWVPGHNDIRGNEMADEMARRDSGHCQPQSSAEDEKLARRGTLSSMDCIYKLPTIQIIDSSAEPSYDQISFESD